MYGSIPHFLKKAGRVFDDAGFSVYLVGGAVRNIVSGHPPVDYDLATDASPEQVSRLFRRVIPTGIKHGTVTILLKGHAVEVTTFRIDGTYTNKRHPDSVSFTPSIEKDLERRDFTINSLALNLNTGELLDPHSGREDLKRGIIRAIGTAEERFSEDGLRLLRACRFAAQLGFSVDPETRNGMIAAHENLKSVSVERIRTELEKILSTPRPSRAFLLMDETGLMNLVLPELAACKGVGIKGSRGHDVFIHSLLSCDTAPPDNPAVRLAALLHDIGKPDARATDAAGNEHYYGHETISEEKARSILRRLKFPRAVEQRVCHLILHHMFDYSPDWTDAAVRRFLHRVGIDYVDDLLMLKRSDHAGDSDLPAPRPAQTDFRRHIEGVLEASAALGIKDLAVNGNVLHEEAGIPRGPVMGVILDALLETVLDDPAQNTREQLVLLATKMYEKIQPDRS